MAFKRALGDAGPDETHELLNLWHNQRRSLVKSRQHLLNEAESILIALPEQVQDALGDHRDVRRRLDNLGLIDPAGDLDVVVRLRLRLLAATAVDVAELDRRDAEATKELAALVAATGSTLNSLPGLATKSAAELIYQTGDARRFTEGGFARFNGTAPLPASSGEGDGEPVRHRLNQGGNRAINAVLHRMAVTQLRCHPPARLVYDNARSRGHTKKEAMRILKRHLSNVVHRTMIRDTKARQSGQSGPSKIAA